MRSIRFWIPAILVLVLWTASLFFPVAFLPRKSAWAEHSAFDACVKEGIEKGFNLEEKEAIGLLLKAQEMDPQNPAAYAYLGFAHLFFYEMNFDEKERKKLREAMEDYTQKALARAEKRIDSNPKDGDAYWALGVAKLTMTRFYITQRRYWAVTREAQNIWDILEKVRELRPENYDVYFAMGILHYHIGHLPGMTRFITSLLVASGDMQKGLEELQLAVKKGYLFRELAQAELISVYSNFEKKPELALPLAKELKERFPRNYNLLFSLANIYSDLGRPEEAWVLARQIETGIQSGSPPFRPELWPRYYVVMGRILFDQAEYDKAFGNFAKAAKNTAPYNARGRASALLRMGMIYDLRQERDLAEKQYQAALDVEGGEGVAQTLAKQYLKTPYLPSGEGQKIRKRDD
jgi:tetratricopeptide (TPR) repeat protein